MSLRHTNTASPLGTHGKPLASEGGSVAYKIERMLCGRLRATPVLKGPPAAVSAVPAGVGVGSADTPLSIILGVVNPLSIGSEAERPLSISPALALTQSVNTIINALRAFIALPLPLFVRTERLSRRVHGKGGGFGVFAGAWRRCRKTALTSL